MFEGIQKSLSDALRSSAAAAGSPRPTSATACARSAAPCSTPTSTSTSPTTFIERVTEQSRRPGSPAHASTPASRSSSIVYDELVGLMGPVDHRIPLRQGPADGPHALRPARVSGKTTTAGKLALTLREQRPQAAARRRRLAAPRRRRSAEGPRRAAQASRSTARARPTRSTVCRNAVAHAKQNLLDTVILDTAGRLHIAEMPMDELKQIDQRRASPTRSSSSATP